MNYYVKAGKADIRSVTPENIQQCLYGMDLDFFKYNWFKAHLQRQKKFNTLK